MPSGRGSRLSHLTSLLACRVNSSEFAIISQHLRHWIGSWILLRCCLATISQYANSVDFGVTHLTFEILEKPGPGQDRYIAPVSWLRVNLRGSYLWKGQAYSRFCDGNLVLDKDFLFRLPLLSSGGGDSRPCIRLFPSFWPVEWLEVD